MAVLLDAFWVAQLGLTLRTGVPSDEGEELEAGGALGWLVSAAVAYCLARNEGPGRSLATISAPPRPKHIRGRIMIAQFVDGAEEERTSRKRLPSTQPSQPLAETLKGECMRCQPRGN